jgi:hypothetical protein
MIPHLIIDMDAPDNVLRMRCTRCGRHLDLSLPVLSEIYEGFKALHAGCKPGGQEP